MKDIQKDPIQAQQAAMPQHDNTALKIVVIVLVVIFGLPLILIIAAFVFIILIADQLTFINLALHFTGISFIIINVVVSALIERDEEERA